MTSVGFLITSRFDGTDVLGFVRVLAELLAGEDSRTTFASALNTTSPTKVALGSGEEAPAVSPTLGGTVGGLLSCHCPAAGSVRVDVAIGRVDVALGV
jgi:hypothetical protein